MALRDQMLERLVTECAARREAGVNVLAQSFPLQAGDEVLTTNLGYGACDAAWHRVCARAGATYRRVEIPLPFDREAVAERLMAAVTLSSL